MLSLSLFRVASVELDRLQCNTMPGARWRELALLHLGYAVPATLPHERCKVACRTPDPALGAEAGAS